MIDWSIHERTAETTEDENLRETEKNMIKAGNARLKFFIRFTELKHISLRTQGLAKSIVQGIDVLRFRSTRSP